MIETVVLENWKSYREAEFSFTGGVNALVGEMGSGKSSVLEAITFGLYGTIPAVKSRKITIDSLLRRMPTKADQARVEVTFSRDDATYTVERVFERGKGKQKSMLRRDGKVLAGPQSREVSDKVAEILGMDFDLFTSVIYAEQNELDFFLTLQPSERKERIDQLLKLDRFEEARSNAVKVSNRLKDRYTDRKIDIDELQDDFDEEEFGELQDDVEEVRNRISELEEERTKAKEKEKELAERLEELQAKQERFEQLEEKDKRMQAQVTHLQEQLSEEQDEIGVVIDNVTREAVEERQEAVEEKAERLDELQDERDDIQQEIEVRKAELEDRKDRIEKLEEQIEALQDLEDVEEKLDAVKERKDEVQKKRSRLEAEEDAIEDAIASLSQAADTCPTCGQELTEQHRVEILKEKKQQKEEIEKQLDTLTNEAERIEERLENVEEKRDRLLQYRGAEEELEETEKNRKELEERIEGLEEEKEKIEEQLSGVDLDLIEEEQDEIERVMDCLDLASRIEEKKEGLEDVEDDLDDLGFDEERFDELKEQQNNVSNRLEVLENKISSREELLEEKSKRLEQYEEMKARIESLQDEVEKLDLLRDFTTRFKDALVETQESMRRRFVRETNDIMQTVWDTVYPYSDYPSIKLDAGEDYVLKLQDDRDNWLPVEGEVSGGERHSAALSLRIALSIVLAPDIGILMLDEPTHNLDDRAIEDLAETLRTEVVDLVDQLFLITHEQQLESAVTGSLYNLRKKDSASGLTEVEETYTPG